MDRHTPGKRLEGAAWGAAITLIIVALTPAGSWVIDHEQTRSQVDDRREDVERNDVGALVPPANPDSVNDEFADPDVAVEPPAAEEPLDEPALTQEELPSDDVPYDAELSETDPLVDPLEQEDAPQENPSSVVPACDPSYAGECIDPSGGDVDCEGGFGDGPQYSGEVAVVGHDWADLDRDGDGIACEPYDPYYP